MPAEHTPPPPELTEETLAERIDALEKLRHKLVFSKATLLEPESVAYIIALDAMRNELFTAARSLASQRNAFAELLLIHEVLMPHKREGESYLQAAARLDSELAEARKELEAEREIAVRLAESRGPERP